MLQHFAYVFIKKIVHISITFFRICEDLFMGSIFPLSVQLHVHLYNAIILLGLPSQKAWLLDDIVSCSTVSVTE